MNTTWFGTAQHTVDCDMRIHSLSATILNENVRKILFDMPIALKQGDVIKVTFGPLGDEVRVNGKLIDDKCEIPL